MLWPSVVAALTLVPGPAVPGSPAERSNTPTAQGVVFHDLDKDGRRDRDEPGVPGVRVSDQLQVTVTDRQGRWSLPLRSDDVAFFVVKPQNWMTPVDEDQLPQFYYIHKPNGSPQTRFPGVGPTGPLPASVDFPLYRSPEPRKFEALFFGDTQPRNVREVEYIRKDVVEPLIGNHDARFGVTLGDIVFDDLSVFGPLVKTIALLGVPWYNVLGNHDINFDVEHDHHSDETWERTFGPNYYSFQHGPVTFFVLDNVHWNRPAGERGGYVGRLGEQQLAWVANELRFVPKNQLIVLCMHIPITGTQDREQLFRLIEDRPYTLSVSAHTHFHEHKFLGQAEGWKGQDPHHHVINVTACGSWWSGAPDEYGIPHTTMRDGAPNGYSIFTFDGNQYSIAFRAARRPETYQIQIHGPDQVSILEAGAVDVYANVFGGSDRSKVEIKWGMDGEWTPMVKTAEVDPGYAKMKEADPTLQPPFRALPGTMPSPHLWKARIPGTPRRGMLTVHIRTTDMFGQTYFATKGILVN